MDCNEALELVTEAVDDRLDAPARSAIKNHFSRCRLCRNEFELEQLVKKAVRQSITRSNAPSDLSFNIRSELSRSSREAPSASLLARLWARPRLRSAFALAALSIIAWILFVSLPVTTHHLHTAPNDINVIHQTLNNFDAVLAGKLKPEVASENPAEVRDFFTHHVSYDVKVPHIPNCKLLGGMLSKCDGKSSAHVVYRHGDDIIYLYQLDLESVLEGKSFALPVQVKEKLLQTGWYIMDDHPKCTLAMWIVGKTLCTAIADIDKSELMGFLAYAE